jgi:predicted TIM-barrel fold metal-dependent hydrolase
MIDDPSTICTIDTIGVENILFESDYPHGDGTWPDTQIVMDQLLGDLPVEQIRMIAYENASKLYGLPIPKHAIP